MTKQNLKVSMAPGKLAVLTDNDRLRAFVAGLPFLGQGLVNSAHNLGVDFAGGRPLLRRKVGNARIHKAALKMARWRQLTKIGIQLHKIDNTGLGPATLFAASVAGLRPTQVMRIRKMYRSMVAKKPVGRSLTADLTFQFGDKDPGILA